MENTKLIIFDFDGTLADTENHIVNCASKCAEKFGLREIKESDIIKFRGAVFADVMLELGATKEQIPAMKEYYKQVFLQDISDIVLYDGVFENLQKLKEQKVKLTIASNRGRNILIPLLKNLNILQFFDEIFSESDVKTKKPSPEIANLILEKTKTNASDAVIVGDTIYDVMLGKNANIKTCLVNFNGENYDDEVLPDFVVYNFKDLLNL